MLCEVLEMSAIGPENPKLMSVDMILLHEYHYFVLFSVACKL